MADARAVWLERADIVLGTKPADDGEMLVAAAALCGDFNVKYGVWTTYFQTRYCEPEKWSDAELEKVECAFWKAAELRAQRFGRSDHGPWCTLAEAYLVKERYVEAQAAYEKAIACLESSGRDGKALARSLYGRANALLGQGRAAEAKSALKAYLARKLPGFGGRYEEHIDSYSQIAVNDMEGGDLDRMRLPRFTGAKAFPEPQEAAYSDSFVAVSSYDLETRGLEAGDRRLELLDVKFTRFGAPRKKGAPFKVTVVVDPKSEAFADLADAPAFRPYMEKEAYVLEVTERGATIEAKTRQGALWGIVSLVQLWDQEKRRIRLAKIRDWPSVETRGYLGTFWEGTLEFTLFNKMNSVCHQSHPCFGNMFRPVNWYIEAFMGRQFHDFGLELFFGNCWMTHAPQLPMCSPRTLPFRVAVCRRYAAAHIGVYYPLDDVRFPICDQDRAAYGDRIAKVDGQHQNAIFQAVVRDYPDWRFIVCPPPYMGPDGRYREVESRDEYLEAWHKELDPRIEAYWTGPRVKSWRFEPYHNEWVLKRYGRRPYLFQNGIYYHNLQHYTVDQIDWPSLYCAGTLDKVLKGYHLNTHTPQCTPRLSTLADALWNTAGYDARRSTERGLAQVSGERTYALLVPALEDLGYFDKYLYGDADERVDLEDRAALERRALNVETCWSNATAYAKSIDAPIYGSFGAGVGWMRRVMDRMRHPPDFAALYRAQLDDIRCIALRETSFDPDHGDVYASPVDFAGGVTELVKHAERGTKEWQKERGQLYRSVKRKGTGHSTASLRFPSEPYPPDADYRLTLRATTDGAPANVRLAANGAAFFEGDPKTGTDPFKPVARTFTIPKALLKRDNLVTVENLVSGTDAEATEGCYRVSYAIVRPEEEDEPPNLDLESFVSAVPEKKCTLHGGRHF